MRRKSEFSEDGTDMAEALGKLILEDMKENPALKEKYNFQEDNNMGNSGDLMTTKLAKAIYYKSYVDFEPYFSLTMNLTPADLGMADGAEVYKIPKIIGTTAVKLADGEAVDYINDNKASLILETETFGIGTMITRRLIKRGAKGFIEKLITAASDSVLRAVATDLVNGMVAGAADATVIAGGIDYDKIEDGKAVIEKAKSATTNTLFGFIANALAVTTDGWNRLAKSTDYKALVQFGQRNVPGQKAEMSYLVFNDLRVVKVPLISVQKTSKDVDAIIMDDRNYSVFLKETEMEVFDGRIPGTAGDREIIHAMDAGSAILNQEAAVVIVAP